MTRRGGEEHRHIYHIGKCVGDCFGQSDGVDRVTGQCAAMEPGKCRLVQRERESEKSKELNFFTYVQSF